MCVCFGPRKHPKIHTTDPEKQHKICNKTKHDLFRNPIPTLLAPISLTSATTDGANSRTSPHNCEHSCRLREKISMLETILGEGQNCEYVMWTWWRPLDSTWASPLRFEGKNAREIRINLRLLAVKFLTHFVTSCAVVETLLTAPTLLYERVHSMGAVRP
jgi:hypothetical protein